MTRGKKNHHVVHDEEMRWKTTPLGVKILTIYSSVLALLYLIFSITVPTNVLFGFVTFGMVARIINFLILIVIVAAVVGFLMKKHWGGKIAFGFFVFEILNLLVSFIFRFYTLKDAFIIFVSCIIIAVDSFIVWYIFQKREYFTDLRHFKSGKVDKIFITGMMSLMIVTLAATTVYGTVLYRDTLSITDKMIDEIHGKTSSEALFRCSFYEGKEKDICYLVSATAYSDVPRSICDEIDTKFYRLTCMQAVML